MSASSVSASIVADVTVPKTETRYQRYSKDIEAAQAAGDKSAERWARFKLIAGTALFGYNLWSKVNAPDQPAGYAFTAEHLSSPASLSDDPERVKFNNIFRLKIGKDGIHVKPSDFASNFQTEKPNSQQIDFVKNRSLIYQDIVSPKGRQLTSASIVHDISVEFKRRLSLIWNNRDQVILPNEIPQRVRNLIDAYKAISIEAEKMGKITKKDLVDLIGGTEKKPSGLIQKEVFKLFRDLFRDLYMNKIEIEIENLSLLDVKIFFDCINFELNSLVKQEFLSIEDAELLWKEMTKSIRENAGFQNHLVNIIDEQCQQEKSFYSAITLVSEYFRQNNLIADVGAFEDKIIERQTGREEVEQEVGLVLKNLVSNVDQKIADEAEQQRQEEETQRILQEQQMKQAEEEQRQAEEFQRAREEQERIQAQERAAEVDEKIDDLVSVGTSNSIVIEPHIWAQVDSTDLISIPHRPVSIDGEMNQKDLENFKTHHALNFSNIILLLASEPEKPVAAEILVPKSSTENSVIRFKIHPSDKDLTIYFDDKTSIPFELVRGFPDEFYIWIQKRLNILAPNHESLSYRITIFQLKDPNEALLD